MAKRLPWQDLDKILPRSFLHLHGFLGVGRSFWLLMQSCRFFVFFSPNFSWKCQISLKKSFYTQRWPCVRKRNKVVWLGCEKHCQNKPKNGKKQPFLPFLIFAKTVHTIRTKFSTVILYSIIWSYVCKFIKIVWLGFERVRRKKTWADSFTAYAALVKYVIEFSFLSVRIKSTVCVCLNQLEFV